MAPPSQLSTRNLAIWKQLPRDLVEIIVDIAADMLDDEVTPGGTGGVLALLFFCEVFNRPLPQWFKDDQAAMKEVEDELEKERIKEARECGWYDYEIGSWVM